MVANVLFQKSLHQLDRGQFLDAVANLEHAIEAAKEENDKTTLAGALCCLGDYFFHAGERDRARSLLEQLVSIGSVGEGFDHELCRARDLLTQIP